MALIGIGGNAQKLIKILEVLVAELNKVISNLYFPFIRCCLDEVNECIVVYLSDF